MASYYWVGGSSTWDLTHPLRWAATSGGAGGAGTPTAADDVFFDAASGASTVTLGTAPVARSVDFTGFTGTFNHTASSTLTIGDGSGGAYKLDSGMNVSLSGGTISFVSTSNNGGTGWGITTAGKTMPPLTFNGSGGKWVCQDGITTAGLITLTAGTLDLNAKTHSWGQFSTAGAVTRVLDATNATINNLAVVQPWTVAGSNLTMTMTGSTINCTVVSGTFTGGAFTYGTVNLVSATTLVAVGANSTFVNLALGSTGKNGQLRINGNITVTGTLTMGGASTQGVNRVLILGGTSPGTQVTIGMAGAAVVINGDTDFMDINITGSPSWTNAGSAFIGDALGNSSLITSNATTPATQTSTGTASFTWSTHGWTTRVPLPQDNVIVNNAFVAGRTITLDMPRSGADIDFSGMTGSPAIAANNSPGSFGSWTMGTITGTLPTNTMNFFGRGTHTFTSNGNTHAGPRVFQNPGGTTTLQDAFISTSTLSITDGTWATNGNAVTCTTFTANSARNTVLDFGASTTLSLTSTAATTVFAMATGGATTITGNVDMVISTASVLTRTIGMSPVSGTINSLTYTVANSPGMLAITPAVAGTSTITTLNVGSGRSLQIFSGRTLNVTNFNVNGAYSGYVRIPGVSGAYISTPDSAAVSILGDIEMIMRLSFDTFAPASQARIFAKRASSTTISYDLSVTTGGALSLITTADGSTTRTSNSSNLVTTGLVVDTTYWIRVTRDATTGSVSFYYAADSVSIPSWTLINTAGGTAGAIFDGTQELEIGTTLGGTSANYTGRIYRAILIDAGTTAFDADLSTKAFGANSFTESSANAATVTINGVTARVGDGRVALTSSTGGSAGTLSKTSGAVRSSYLSIQDSTATGGASWYALPASVDVSGNTGWIFNVPVDLVTVSESVGYYSELVALREQYTLLLTSPVNVSESISVTESVALVVTPQFVNVSDSIAVTESVTPLVVSFVNKSDSITLTESVQLVFAVLANISESVTVSESATVQPITNINVSETITVTENVANGGAPNPSVSENISVSEAIMLNDTDGVAVMESISVTESVSVTLSAPQVSVSDSITVSESKALSPVSFVNKTDSISVTEAVTAQPVTNISKSESVTVTENTSVVAVTSISVSDSITLGESTSILSLASVSKSESITVSESVAAVPTPLSLAVSDNITVSDSPTVIAVAGPPPPPYRLLRGPRGVIGPRGTRGPWAARRGPRPVRGPR